MILVHEISCAADSLPLPRSRLRRCCSCELAALSHPHCRAALRRHSDEPRAYKVDAVVTAKRNLRSAQMRCSGSTRAARNGDSSSQVHLAGHCLHCVLIGMTVPQVKCIGYCASGNVDLRPGHHSCNEVKLGESIMSDQPEYNGGKFPNSGETGLGLEEFIDSAGVNSASTGAFGEQGKTGSGAVRGSRLDSTLAIVAGAAVGLLLGIGIGRGRRK